jgi:hypothetical protein
MLYAAEVHPSVNMVCMEQERWILKGYGTNKVQSKVMKISIRITNCRIQSRNIMTAIHTVNDVNPFTIRNGVVKGIAAICKGINLLKP